MRLSYTMMMMIMMMMMMLMMMMAVIMMMVITIVTINDWRGMHTPNDTSARGLKASFQPFRVQL